jgi:hypothetical protein
LADENGQGLELGDGQTVVLASPRIRLSGGISPSSRFGAVRGSGVADTHEFVTFLVPASNETDWGMISGRYDDPDLAAVIAIGNEASKTPPATTSFLPIPSVCELRNGGYEGQSPGSLAVRCNCLGILEMAHQLCEDPQENAPVRPYLRVFVLAADHGWGRSSSANTSE